MLEPLGQGEPVHPRHHGVEQDEGERLAGALQGGQRRRPAVGDRRPHPPVREHLLEDEPVRGVVVHDEDGQPVDPGRLGPGRRRDRSAGRGEPGGEVERAPLADLALQPDAAAHHLDQPGRDRQAQPGAAVLAGGRGVRLRERPEQLRLLLRGDADAGVPNLEVQSDEPGVACLLTGHP